MNKYIKIIKEKNPSLIIEKYHFNAEGQNNDIVIVNDNTVFKFPKYLEGIKKLKIEIDILNILKKHSTLDIPEYNYKNLDPYDTGNVYGGYRMIKGVSLRQSVYHNVVRKENISKQLATFLRELHSIPIEEFYDHEIKFTDTYSEWTNFYDKIETKLFKFMRKEAKDSISKNFDSFLNHDLDFDETIIHGDFGPTNIIFDPNSQIISGIIDFNDVSIGDPATDIASLIGPFGYGEDFVKSFKPIYPEVDCLLDRARFYASTFALQEAMFGLEVGDEAAFNSGIKQYI